MENYQIQQEINIDFSTPDVPPRVYAKQYDNNMRIIKANLYANGQPYTVQSGFEVNVRMAKPDGTYVYNPALEISDTYVLIVLTQQMLAVAGECPAEIEVVQGGNVLSTATFVICVARDTVPEDAIESTDEFKTIQEILDEVEAASKIVTDNLDAINAVSENIEAIKDAPQQAQAAANSAKLAESWAVGGTGSREDEDTDNAKYYAQIAQQIAQGSVGWYETPEALRAAHPTGQAGNWAIVGSTDTIWVWDVDGNDWKDTHGNINLSDYYTKTEADSRFAKVSESVPTVTASKEQNYFDIELPSTNQFVIVPDTTFAEGDTFRIAGRPVAAMLPSGESLPDAFFAANAKVMCLWADTTLYFVGGGGGGTVPSNVMRYRLDDGTPAQPPTPINADRLQGHSAEYFATAAGLDALAAQAVMPYKAGDAIKIGNIGVFNGFITGSGTLMRFTIPICKPVTAPKATITGFGKIRQNGKYLLGTGTGEYPAIDALVSDVEINPGFIYVELTQESGFADAVNNDTAAFATTDLTITFGEAT